MSKHQESNTKPKYWVGPVKHVDDFGNKLTDEFLDARTKFGPWGILAPDSYADNWCGKLGTGFGQKYKLQPDGQWLKVEG